MGERNERNRKQILTFDSLTSETVDQLQVTWQIRARCWFFGFYFLSAKNT